MDRVQRLRSEQHFHDGQASRRAQALRPEDYRVDDEGYLRHAPWIGPAMTRLGDVRGLDVLDLGCGHGMASVVLARRGARVTACDLSLGYLREARRRAGANGVGVRCVQADGEALPFADGSFDRAWGNAVLHHLDIARAARELARVLRPGGAAVFCEPWGENRWLSLARRHAPYPGKARTADEDPLRATQLRPLRRAFASVHVEGFQLLSMASRVLPWRRIGDALSLLDAKLLDLWPGGRRYCRYVVITMRR